MTTNRFFFFPTYNKLIKTATLCPTTAIAEVTYIGYWKSSSPSIAKTLDSRIPLNILSEL